MGSLLVAGASALRRYPGMAAALYAVQFLVSAIAAWIMATALAAAFSTRPLFDEAVAGDTLATALLFGDNLPLVATLVAVAIGAALSYAALSWFLAGGLIATVLARPTGRRAVAEQFGAAGAATFFAYARLGLCCLIPHATAVLILLLGIACAYDDLELALTAGQAVRIILPTALPALALAWLTATAAGYARVDLARNRDKPAALALVDGYLLLATRWRALAHALLFAGAWLAITALFVLGTDGYAMSGAAGALTLLALRQLTAILRFTAKLALVAGQVEMASGVMRDAASSRCGDAEAR